MDARGQIADVPNPTAQHAVWTKGGAVFAHLPDATIQTLEGRTIATFADTSTLGMWAFATGSALSGVFQANLLPAQQIALLFPVLAFYSGLVLLSAGLLQFRRNNSFQASAFCSFGAFNLARGVLLLCEGRGILPGGASANILQGVLLAIFATKALFLLIAATRMNNMLVLVFGCTALGFALSAPEYLANSLDRGAWGSLGHAGGFALLAAALFALYGGGAMLMNTAWRRSVLPIGGQA